MAKKRKRVAGPQHEDERIEQISNYDLTRPKQEGAHLYTHKNELPWDLEPYWKQRHGMFSLYDHGIWTTDDSWFEVTHESVATKIAQHIAAAKPSNKVIILDCFAGIGGNAIAFALSGYKRVYAIEKNPAALACARHNAEIYGVHDRITFFEGDCFDILGLNGHKEGVTISSLAEVVRKAGIIFGSPPWGGPSYKEQDVFNLDLMPYSFEYMYSRFAKVTKDMVLYLPRTSDLNQMADCLASEEKAQIVHYCTYENSRAMCAYLGDWKEIPASQ